MSYVLRDYQQKASDAAVSFFNNKAKKTNAIMVLPTGSGKSLIIADIAARLDGHTLVFQPSKEILEHILEAFKAGEIPVVANVGVLTTGFDYPELDTVVMARPTMSLAMWYQIVGRVIRPHPSKECGWIVDLCGSTEKLCIDHIFPVSRGGFTVLNNLQVLCEKCNLRKNNKI